MTQRLLTAAILLGVLSATTLAQPGDPLVGTWKLDVAKSKAPFKSGSTTIDAVPDGIKFVVDLEGTDGTKNHWAFTAKFDGKDYPITGSSPYGDSVSVARMDPRTIRITAKQAGKVTTTHTIAVSADGKTRTTTAKGTDIKGQPVNTVSYYEKQ
jgi:hypothetical protein